MYGSAQSRVEKLLTHLTPSFSSFRSADVHHTSNIDEKNVSNKQRVKEMTAKRNECNKKEEDNHASNSGNSEFFEVVIIGAGVTGICQLYHLAQLGFHVKLLEASQGLGGTWYNNRYPGCRFDSESYTYGYSFSREIIKNWKWSEIFTSQSENLNYLKFVCETFQLEKYMQFNTCVKKLIFNEAKNMWHIYDTNDREYITRFLVTSVGYVNVPVMPRIEGKESFKGLSFHSHHWPHSPLDLKDKKVAVIGTGPSGMQLISEIAHDVRALTVFQRSANWSAPLNNAQITPHEMSDFIDSMDSILQKCSLTPHFFIHQLYPRSFYKTSREERVKLWEQLWQQPGFGIWLSNFPDILFNKKANDEFCEFVAGKIRERVKNKEIAEKLIPKNFPFGGTRVVLEKFYYEVYNRENVLLVDIKETPITKISEKGIHTTDTFFPCDIIVYATGFDTFTGSYDKIDIRGVGGQSLQDKWKEDVSSYLGMQAHGFPNLFMAPGPQGVGGSVNWTRAAETMVGYITNLLVDAKKNNIARIEPKLEAEQKWGVRIKSAYKMMPLISEGVLTGYNSNIPGRERGKVRHLISFLGATRYKDFLKKEESSGYANLHFSSL